VGALSFDTTFLIDFQRERRTGGGRAHRFLKENREEYAYLSTVVVGEFYEGFESSSNPVFLTVIESFELLEVKWEAALIYGDIVRGLRANGRLIGANDLWIAAVALAHSMPLVTRNVDHFSRVPHLQVIAY